MSTSGVSPYSTKFRIGGLATGMDTDQIVKDLMRVEKIPLDKVLQKKQLAEWRRDDYRNITNLLRGFKNDYFDFLKPANNMLSQSTYKRFIATSMEGSTTSTVVSASGTVNASTGTHTVTVNQLATADAALSAQSFTGTGAAGLGLTGTDFNITIDGELKNISFTSDPTSFDNLVSALQDKLNTAFGSGKVAVSHSAGVLNIATAGSSRNLTLAAGTVDALTVMNVAPGSVNAGVTKTLQSTAQIVNTTLSGKTIKVALDGVTKEIALADYADVEALKNSLQASINTAFGSGKILVDKVGVGGGDGLKFSTVGSTVSRISLYSGTTNDGLQNMNFTSGTSNRLSTGWSLGQIAGQLDTPLTFAGGTSDVTSTGDITNLALNGKKFNLTIDGVTKEITFASDPASVADLGTTLQGLIDAQFGAGKITVAESPANRLTLTRGAGTGYFTITSGIAGSNALEQLNFISGTGASGQLKFTVNSKEFTFNASQTLSAMMGIINADSTAKVNITYDETSDKFNVAATQLGAGSNIDISQTLGNFFSSASKINTGTSVTTQGVDAEAVIDGQTLLRSSNVITVNGVTYTLLRQSATEQKVTLSSDVDSVYNSIKSFVDKYNEIIATVNSKISEEYDRNYQPLTSEQKGSMSEDDIKKWEDKAKTGLLKNDTIIQNMLYGIRKGLTDNITGISASLSSIGITTGTYDEKGKLHIDETKLRNAIQNDPDSVMSIFAKQSSYTYYDTGNRNTRYSEEGIAYRMSDIIDDNIRTSRDVNNLKGTLLEKAGMVGDGSEFTSILYKEIYDYDIKIVDFNNKLNDKEDKYYKKFAAMERAISQMNSQSKWLASQLGGS